MELFEFSEVPTPLGVWTIVFRAEELWSVSLCSASGGWLEPKQAELSKRLGAPALFERGAFPEAQRQLCAYASGCLREFTLSCSLRGLTRFHTQVLEELRRVPFGTAVSYGELAQRVGRPGGAQAIGGAMGRNPLPVDFPCHRVLAAGAKIGGFTGGIDVKRRLLSLESIAVGT